MNRIEWNWWGHGVGVGELWEDEDRKGKKKKVEVNNRRIGGMIEVEIEEAISI